MRSVIFIRNGKVVFETNYRESLNEISVIRDQAEIVKDMKYIYVTLVPNSEKIKVNIKATNLYVCLDDNDTIHTMMIVSILKFCDIYHKELFNVQTDSYKYELGVYKVLQKEYIDFLDKVINLNLYNILDNENYIDDFIDLVNASFYLRVESLSRFLAMYIASIIEHFNDNYYVMSKLFGCIENNDIKVLMRQGKGKKIDVVLADETLLVYNLKTQ